jgi:hypothetical protein
MRSSYTQIAQICQEKSGNPANSCIPNWRISRQNGKSKALHSYRIGSLFGVNESATKWEM